MYGAPEVWDALMRKIAGDRRGVPGGAGGRRGVGGAAVRLVGRRDVAPGLPRARDAVLLRGAGRGRQLGVPRIHFGVGTGELLGLMGEAGADVVGVDWRVPFSDGVRRAGGRAVQGNLDPSLVFAPTEVMLARAEEILDAGRAAPGHIFNLGHGVLPSTDPDQLARLTDFVHEHSAR